MKSAFAKLMMKDPTESSHIAFRAGGNGVPILTRASGSSTTGYQTMGLPDGSRPMPGGGANRTVLGAYRMGDQDGNGPAVAGFNSDDIFGPYGQPDREYPERYFSNIGNNTFQPENDDRATISLLKRLGDQKFKAESMAPFEDYMAQQRLARDLDEASRHASLSDLGMSREIIRNLAAERRQQNEDDYLRKMLDAGATPEAARKEIEDVRNANAIQEAKKVEDRSYQAKMLISRIAMARGVTPMVREPLNQSSSIDNPQRSQAMSQAMGMPGEGFGTSPLDANRQFLTPDFYRKYLRRSTVSQEASDEATAFGQLITGSGDLDKLKDMQNGFSMATIKGQERQIQVENAAEGLASRLDAIRQRQVRIKLPLARTAVGKEILDELYRSKAKKIGEKVIYSPETIDSLNPLQLLLSINFNAQAFPLGFQKLTKEVKKYTWGSPENVPSTYLNDFRKVALAMNKGEQNVRIPFPSVVLPFATTGKFIDLFNNIKQGALPALRLDIDNGRAQLLTELDYETVPDVVEQKAPTQVNQEAVTGNPMAQAPIPGAPGGGLTRAQVDAMTKAEVQAALAARNVSVKPKNMAEKKLKDLLKANLG